MTLAGLHLAARISRRSEFELLAQAVDGLLLVWRDANGGFYFDQDTLPGLPRRATCAVKGCPKKRTTQGLCSTHDKRRRRGADMTERIHSEKARHAAYVVPSGREPLPVAERGEQAEADLLERYPDRARRLVKLWSFEDRQAERLGTPDVWQKVEDDTLERAWAQILDGSYAEQRRATLRRHPPIPVTPQRPVQSPLLVAMQGECEAEPLRRSA